MRSDRTHLDRRRFLALGGMAAIGAACSSSSADDDTNESAATTSASTTQRPANTAAAPVTTEVTSTSVAADDATTVAPTETAPAAFGAADFERLGVCTLLAETAAGPFPNLARLERRDVTEGYQGHPLRLGLRVVDEACVPVAGAVVEIWHADASGDYSSYADGGGGKDEGRARPSCAAPDVGGRRDRRVPHDLPGLVSGASGPHPSVGPRRRRHRADQPTLLRRRLRRAGPHGRALRRVRATGHVERARRARRPGDRNRRHARTRSGGNVGRHRHCGAR